MPLLPPTNSSARFQLPVSASSLLSVEELALPPVCPRIVLRGEVGAVLYAGMVVLPELDEGAGVGVFEPGLAQGLKAGNSGLLRVGNQGVNGLLAVDVGLVLEVPAHGVGSRLKHE